MNRRGFLRIAGLVGGAVMLDGLGVVADGNSSAGAANVSRAPLPPIDSTGASDVTSDLQGWLNSVPDGSRLIVPPGARYRIDGTLAIRGKKHWTITCPKGTKPVFTGEAVEGARERAQWFLDDCEDIKFHRIRAEGSNRRYVYNVALESQSAWWIAGSQRVELSACEAEWTYGDFVQVQGDTIKDVGHPSADGVWIHDCTTRHIGRIVLVTNNVRNVLFEKNRCHENKRSFWDAEPNFRDQQVEHIYIQDNVIGSSEAASAHFEASGGKPTERPVQKIIVRRNDFEGVSASLNFGLPRGTSATQFARRRHIYWSQNHSTTPTSFPYALTFKETNFVYARDNTQKIGASRRYMALIGCCGWNNDSTRPNEVTRPNGSTHSMYSVSEPCNVRPAPRHIPSRVPEPLPVWPFTEA
jgi:hypothetical protein